MRRFALVVSVFVMMVGAGVWAQVNRTARNPSDGFYTQEQATAGKAVFTKACSSCHTADANKPADSDFPMKLPIALNGELFLQKWRTVGDLYSKVSQSMPLDTVIGIAGLKQDEYVNLMAYLLQVNGLAPGRELKVDGMKSTILDPHLAGRPAVTAKAATGAAAFTEGYYTEEQAKRGREYFLGNCGLCHTAEGLTVEKGPPWGGRLNGRGHLYNPVVSPNFAERYRSVAGIYNKVRTTMPGHDSGGLSAGEYVDIVSYIMKMNGQPAGNVELKDDLPAMRGMTLVEKGFRKLFNGRDFTGFKFLLGANCTPKPTGCGKTDPAPTFHIENGTVICTGKPYGYMYTEDKYLDFTLRFEYRFIPWKGMEGQRDSYHNSGTFLFINKLQVWPPYIEIQPTMGVTVTGAKAVFTSDNEARRRAQRPIGEWNDVEIVSANRQIKASLNGELISTVTEHEYEAGYLGFQSEGSEIHWRNIRIKN